ncbi:nucleotide-diphospho-sugar transferase [Lipomyces kononenkoae]|uniref:Nucleotide-diphospho-sugar transferase n=1 Tax=Lipomyces kononenkoae TaxID=34357 RepID=A0ACC3T091_LIPKO
MERWSATLHGAGFWALFYLCGPLIGALIGWALLRHRLQRPKQQPPSRLINVNSIHPIAVVIPALNEAIALPKTVSHLFSTCALPSILGCAEPEVIVVDAGSSDDSESSLASLVSSHPTLRFLTHPFPSRGTQQNIGAKHTTTPILLFLHADTLTPNAWDATILSTLSSDTPPDLGSFSLSLPHPTSYSLRLMLLGANVRARYIGLPYGDQAYFLRRTTFDAVGGFPDVPIMEDVELLRRIRRTGGHVAVLDDQVITSPRRWIKNGVIWNTILNQILVGAWLMGVKPNTIYTWYYGKPPIN